VTALSLATTLPISDSQEPIAPRVRPKPSLRDVGISKAHSHRVVRSATYRVQLHAGFTFDDAGAIADYLAALSISHLYCSPCLQAAAGSKHGYDVVDHGRLSEELGGEPGYARLLERLGAARLGALLDIVPNHMALAGRANSWWWGVLENGPSSLYAGQFDIDWNPPEQKLSATVLMPILGDHYGRVLEAGDLEVERRNASFVVRYHDQEAPISPRSLDDLLCRAADKTGCEELRALALAFGRLPHALLTNPASVAERHRDKEVLEKRLAALCVSRRSVARAIDAEVGRLNHDADHLDELLRRQNYRLAYWRTASEELSYRRFFNIDTLVGLRIEDPRVFGDTHRLILDLVARGVVDGLRVDHVDGLRDPETYLCRLRNASEGTYVVVEKILAAGEGLPESWPVAGTTGYDFLNRVSNLFVDPTSEAALSACYARYSGGNDDYAAIARDAKLQIMTQDLAAEVERLTARLADICQHYRRHRDHTRRDLRDALREVIAAFPVYRTYVQPGGRISDSDRAHVRAAVLGAKARRADLDAELLDFIGELLVLAHTGDAEVDFTLRFAQLSSPVMAKGEEDTAFYRYHRLISLNEVGGDPATFGRPVEDFHRAMAEAAERWPEAMLALSTHDTKRSGDVRARLNLLSELPEAWEQAVHRWSERNKPHKHGGWPDGNAEYLLYQTLVGAWPITAERTGAFMAKATKEARVHTSWIDPKPDYDEAVQRFVVDVLGDRDFIADLEAFLCVHRLVERGRVNSLSQTALLLTCPGIPDIYQGTEVWDHSLVDPDNRLPVDYELRRALLKALDGAEPEIALSKAEEGGPKLWLIHRVLEHRRRHPRAYGPSSRYEPLCASGAKAQHLVAFARSGGLVVLVPRLLVGLGDDWCCTTVAIPRGEWTNILSRESVEGGDVGARALLGRFPMAVLARDE
jgi:(1->4)-alpha-D-glucan 1-alpha-D-glucosylmutase